MNEFELIRTYFARQPVKRADVIVGIGDDAAVLVPPAGRQLCVTTDVLVAGVHFLPGDDPIALGHKSLAVNLSDLAAMGAEPAWFTLNLTIPEIDIGWIEKFCQGLFALARQHNTQLVGGNTSRGPLAIAIEAQGFVPAGGALLRSGAQPGDRIYVTGELGDAALALAHRQKKQRVSEVDAAALSLRLDRPTARIEEGMALRKIASSAIDISDGLLADLGHILQASAVGARVILDKIPVSAIYRAHLNEIGWDLALAGGEDYELCCTIPQKNLAALAQSHFASRLTHIGEIEPESGLRIVDEFGKPYRPQVKGHDHFAL